MSKTIITAIVSALIAGLLIYFITHKESETTNVKVTVESIKNITELAVVEYTLSESLETTLPKGFGNLRDATFFIYVKGVIKGSVNLEEGVYEIDNEKRTATISFPDSAIVISNPAVDEDDIQFTTCKDRILNKIKDEDRNKAYNKAIKVMKQTALDNGIIDKVKNEAKLVLENYLVSFGYQTKIVFQ